MNNSIPIIIEVKGKKIAIGTAEIEYNEDRLLEYMRVKLISAKLNSRKGEYSFEISPYV